MKRIGLIRCAIIALTVFQCPVVFSQGGGQTPPANGKGGRRIETEVVTITRVGISPSSIVRPKGPFFLQIVDHDLISLGRLSLDSPDIASTVDTVVDQIGLKERRRSAQELNLHPGTYVLKFSDAPSISCQITIQ